MDSGDQRRRTLFHWLFMAALLLLCGVLAALQYRWAGELSRADLDRLRGSLHASLDHISQDVNLEISSAIAALVRATPVAGAEAEKQDTVEKEFLERFGQWKAASRHAGLLSRVGLVFPRGDQAVLRTLDLERSVFSDAPWPEEWAPFRERMRARLSAEPWTGRRPPEFSEGDDLSFEIPRFGIPTPGGSPPPFGRREAGWLLVQLNPAYLAGSLLPELVHRRLGSDGRLDYQVDVVSRRNPRAALYRSATDQAAVTAANADATVPLLDMPFDRMFQDRTSRAESPGARPRGFGFGPRGPGGNAGRWLMLARHRSGSLDAVVTRARWRNLAVTSGILLLMLVTAAALIRFTRRAQRLAELQMNFVASVSHELRTPLTVIQTAAYNLRDGLARDPVRVERYGALIQQESARLGRLVEQVLRFASTSAGRVIRTPEPVSVESVIEDAVESTRPEIEQSQLVLESHIDPGLPLVMGDPLALKHALQNLIGNAAKYGAEGGQWLGITALATDGETPAVEIRVADRGPGIPPDEQERIFEPFFRGRRALRDQVHGTGLGLNLAKRIVEAHGGTIRVHSEEMKGTEFIVRIPAAPAAQQDEFTNTLG